ncbi:MAG TPA: hypothetical protein VHL09_13885 [Dehalococcoidia bacterium]|nr:hypothetical protein [Dehalococcoidia bacterium]
MTSSAAGATLIGVFDDRDHAERALEELRSAGFRDDQLGVVLRGEETGADAAKSEAGDDPAEDGTLTGALTGGTIGGLIGAGAALLVPGIGPILAGGILTAALGGAAAGAVAGTLLGSLGDLTGEEAGYYEGELRSGRILAVIRPDGPAKSAEAAAILRRHGAAPAEATTAAGTPRPIPTPPTVTEPRVVAPSVLPPLTDDEPGDKGRV